MSDFWAGTARTAEWLFLVGLIGLGLGAVWAVVDAALTKLTRLITFRRRPARHDPDLDRVLAGYAPRSFGTKAAKGFRREHASTIVDFAQRRRAR